MVSLVSGASLAGGGNSDKAQLCQKGGYLSLGGTNGPFATQSACVSYAAEGGVLDLPVGFVLPSAYGFQLDGLTEALAEAGYNAPILTTENTVDERASVEGLIGQGVKVLVLAPQDSEAAAAVADDAHVAGVKVIAYDRLIRGTASVDYYVTFDGMAVGEAMARFLIHEAGTTTGNSLYLYAGNAEDNNSFLFLEGAWETLQPFIADGTFVIRNSAAAAALKAEPVLTREQQAAVIAEIDTQWSHDVAYGLASDDVAAAPPAGGTAFILAPNDWTAGAISVAFLAAGVSSYFVTGQDANRDWVQRLIDGTPGMTVLKDPQALADDAIASAVAFLLHRTPVATTTYDNGVFAVPSKESAIVAVTLDNIQETLIDTGTYDPDDFTGTWPGRL
jgi:putative multiple sugar transport system substrate-binding protein